MKRTVIVVSLLVLGVALFPYEDNTHQKLTDRAIQVASEKGGMPSGFFSPAEKQSIIAGAGNKTWGEDYSRYDIYGPCPPLVDKYLYKGEPLSHFASGLFGADPAWVRFLTFWTDAIDLWRKGKREDAAFILGRAVHLVEDMAQPQHAMNEWHLDRAKL